MKLKIKKSDFPTADNFVYLNAANVSLMYSKSEYVINKWYKDVARNGSNNFDENKEEEVFEGVRKESACLINTEPENIAIGSSATELLCSVAWAVLPAKKHNIVSTKIVFPSTIYPWMRIANNTGCEIRLAKENDSFVDIDEIIRLIDYNTSVVCISHVEYGNGQIYDLNVLSKAAKEHGALFIVDATQSAGSIPIDVKKTSIDILVSGAYKWLCGPFGAAFMYINPSIIDKIEPGLVGFRSHNKMWDLDGSRIQYPTTGRKFEFSTMAFGCALGLEESIKYINSIGVEAIYEHNRNLSKYLIAGLKNMGGQILSPDQTKIHSSIIKVYFNNINSELVVKRLNKKKVYVSKRGESIRLSPHLYNTKEHIEKALKKLKNILKVIN